MTVAELGDDLLALDEAPSQLAAKDQVMARLVELHHCAGLTIEEAALAVGLSTTTAFRYWTYARAWLHAELKKDAPGKGG